MKGLFITFEGIEGCGKSTQAQRLFNWLEKQGYDCVLSKEPGGTKICERIREILLDKENNSLSETSEFFLYLADRAEHIRAVIRPALEKGKIVISDRFSDSTLAYQSAGRGIPGEIVKNINTIATGGLIPDITIVIDVPPEVGLARLKKKDRIEEEVEDFHKRIRAEYLNISREEPDRVKVVDGTEPVEKVEEKVREIIIPLLRGLKTKI